MEIVFAAARAALKEVPAPLNNNQFWSFAALDVIDKSNYLPMKSDGAFTPSPDTEMMLHGNNVDDKEGPNKILPFRQQGWIINTAQQKNNLEDRAAPAQYLRWVNKNNYQVYRRDTKKITTIRTCKFVLALKEKHSRSKKQQNKTKLTANSSNITVQ